MNNNIFCNLPDDIIKNILLYDEHFIMREGTIVSIIPKTDYRYKLLNFITLHPSHIENSNTTTYTCTYKYDLPNLYNYKGRSNHNSDLMHVNINEYSNFVKYSIWIGRQYPKHFICNKKQNYYIENPLEYNWIYTEYEYIRT
jgi:hypothetical protein